MIKRWIGIWLVGVTGLNQSCTPVGLAPTSVSPTSVDMIEAVAIPGYDLELINMEDVLIPETLYKSRIGNPESYEEFGERYKVLQSSQGFKEKGRQAIIKIDNNTNITINKTAIAGLAEKIKDAELEQS